MNVRRSAAVVSVLLAVAMPRADATGSKALDGKRHARADWSGWLSSPALEMSSDRANSDLLTPTRADCSATSCDVTQFELTLPRRVTYGRFSTNLLVQRTLNLYVILYDASGGVVQQIQTVDPTDIGFARRYMPLCCGLLVRSNYYLDLLVPRLRAGRYTLVVYNRGGTGTFTAVVEYTALHPDRTKS